MLNDWIYLIFYGDYTMENSRELVRQKVVELLKSNPQGLRYMELHSLLSKAFPKIPPNTIHGALWTITTIPPKGVYKPTRGLYKFSLDDIVKDTAEPGSVQSTTLKEEQFMGSVTYFAETTHSGLPHDHK
jgi:hypothetical protein